MLFGRSKSHIGVDIGTSNIKIVQLKPEGDKFHLETYGLVNVAYHIAGKDSKSAMEQTAQILKNLVEKSQATTRKIVASLPNSVVFTSVIELPIIPENELRAAVEFEAKKYVPLPMEEVTLDWNVIQSKKPQKGLDTALSNLGRVDSAKQKIILTAVPNMVIENYRKVFDTAGLEPLAMEIEAMSLIRSLVNEDDKTVLVVDIGAKNTGINLIDYGYLRFSKNINVGGDTVTTSIAQSLGINFSRAEQFKKDFGLSPEGQQLPSVIKPIIDIIRNEAAQIINLYESKGEGVDQVLLSGAGSKLPGIIDYFSATGKPVLLANPWSKVVFSPDLAPVIEPLGLNLAVAAGLSMRKF
jgi:type IV pilus assembly protein PilM